MEQRSILNVSPTIKQTPFLISKNKFPAFVGGLGSGKTFIGCLRAIIEAFKGQDGIILAPTYPMLKDATQEVFFDILDTAGIFYEWNKSDQVVYLPTPKAKILFRSADKPDRLRGPNLSWAYLDEMALMKGLIWKIIIGRLRIGKTSAWGTTTPAGFNWVWEKWVDNPAPGYKIFHATTRDNPYLSTDYIEDLENDYTGSFAKQEIDGEFVSFEGLVYEEFRRDDHMIDFELAEGWQRCRAIDWGYTNPFVCLWGATDHDGRLYIYDEHYKSKTLIEGHANEINSRGKDKYTFTVADHDAQDNAEIKKHGIVTVNAKKNVIEGIRKVKARLKVQPDGKPRLFIHPRCVNLIKEIGLYSWAEGTGGVIKEEPIKQFDHALDALRYMVMHIDKPQPRVRMI